MAYHDKVAKFIENNKKFAETWQEPPMMSKLRSVAKANKDSVLILTCLDPRCVPEQFFGPNIGVGVIRNGGGRPTTDVLRTILALRTLADVQALIVVHHTDCGLTYMTDAGIGAEARTRTPTRQASSEVESVEHAHPSFGCFTTEEYEHIIKHDVMWLREKESLKGVDIYGMSFDLKTGLVTDVMG